jgi:hypothetical protein
MAASRVVAKGGLCHKTSVDEPQLSGSNDLISRTEVKPVMIRNRKEDTFARNWYRVDRFIEDRGRRPFYTLEGKIGDFREQS